MAQRTAHLVESPTARPSALAAASAPFSPVPCVRDGRAPAATSIYPHGIDSPSVAGAASSVEKDGTFYRDGI